MTKFDWVFIAFAAFCLILLTIIAVCAGYNHGRKETLSELCGKTNGKYEFCIEVKQWEIKDIK